MINYIFDHSFILSLYLAIDSYFRYWNVREYPHDCCIHTSICCGISLMFFSLSLSHQFYIALLSLHGLFLGIYQFIICVRSEWRECSSFSPPATVVLLLFLIFESLLFAIFTAVMFFTQVNAIWNDETVSKEINMYSSKF